MQFRRPLFFVFLIMVPFAAAAQNTDEVVKERQKRLNMLIEQVVADLPNLALGENRAVVNAKLGNLLWASDTARARVMFNNAASELISAQTFAEANQKRSGNQSDLTTGGSTRTQILNTIANRDAELALELLLKTRPALVVKALAEPQPQQGAKVTNGGNYAYLAQNETNLEQSYIRKAAEQNPERTVKLLKETLAKEISNETLNLLKKLYERDPEAAKEIAAKLVDKLAGSNLNAGGQSNYQVIQNSINFLNDFVRDRGNSDKSFSFDESQMRSLGQKIISYVIANSNNQAANYSGQLIQIAEKLSPSNAEQLKTIAKNGYGRRGDWGYYDPELQKLFSGETTGDQLLAAVKKYPAESRPQIYSQAVSKFIQQGDMSRAATVISDNYAGDALEDAMRNLSAQYAYRLTNEGKFAEAEQILDAQPENVKMNSLLNLANAIYQKDPVENKSYATAVIGKVRALLPESPENNNDMSNFMQVINAYSNIDSPEATRMFEQLVPQINELADAAAVLNPFQGNANYRNGEFIMSQGTAYGNFGIDTSIIGRFAQKDLDQATRLIDLFRRRETRISLKLQLAESLN